MVRLAARRVRGRLDGERDDGRGDRRRGRHAAGPDGYASLLRLQHGGLFWSLAGYGEENTEAAQDFPRQLVPQRRGWKVPVAGVRRKRARAEVDSRARGRPRGSAGDAGRLRPGKERADAGWIEDFRGIAGRTAARESGRLGSRDGRFQGVSEKIRRTPAAANPRRT